MMEELSRLERLVGAAALEKLAACRIAVFGIGGVGGHAAEALVRSGIGTVDLIDGDTVSLSNINRQIIALHSTAGRLKVDVAAERFLDINPEIIIRKFPLRFSEETAEEFNFTEYDYVVDAIDDVRAKVPLAVMCKESGTPLISSMGAGNKLDPTRFKVADIYKTSVCPLARVMRTELRKRGIEKLKCVFSDEPSVCVPKDGERAVPASCAFVPSVAGLIIASEVVKDLMGTSKNLV